MHTATQHLFPHRLNKDGTYDSICTVCLLTIATASAESELSRYEHNHSCDPIRLYQISEYLPLPALSSAGIITVPAKR